MALIECTNGHLYDNAQFPSCPYCISSGNRIDFGGAGKTVALSAAPAQQEIGATVAPASYRAAQGSSDTGKTVGVFQVKTGVEPVVGWLVCVEGPEKGQDYRICSGGNTIGRDEKMNIRIKGDPSISRENHARVVYDQKHMKFHVIPGESANMLYINDEPVFMPTEIKAGDIMELGKTKLIFVPLCGELFRWDAPADGEK